MIKLHGMSRSNYYSLTKACFVEKGMAFEEINAMPSQDEDYLTKSPMGKVPCIETDQGFISESLAIADYLDQIQPEKPLLPTDPFARAKNIELIRHLELDVELVARRCLPEAFFGATVSDETKQATQKDLKRGMKAVSRLFVCDPYAAGSEFSLADLYTFYTFGLAGAVVQKIFGEDLLAELPQVKSLIDRLAERDAIREVEAAKQ
ncbi:MAG: glutathione S-transferase family protein [Pseudomonadales bacterium]